MSSENKNYCISLTAYNRIKTATAHVGVLGIGGENPIRVQSMATTDTMNTTASVAQAIRMIEAGCELVRFTAPSMNEAENLKNIRAELNSKGYDTPLVADIHFTPNAAEEAALHVEKIRVNPGNYVDKKKFENIEYTDESYAEELKKIREKFTPLVLLCKEKNRAMRIGTNHGSLSDRIMSRYGDSPLGMVESALEFVQICEDNAFYNLVISMKSSNPQVMVQAYRLLVARMLDRGRVYPLHLGVTEAGEGEDGRIKSAVGIGTLLEDGIGDTIRVSLTEEPEFEIPVARALADRYAKRDDHDEIAEINFDLPYNPFEYERRKTNPQINIGGKHVPIVIASLAHQTELRPAQLFPFGYIYNQVDDKWTIKDQAVDYIYTGSMIPEFELPGTLGVLCNASVWEPRNQVYPVFNWVDYFLSDLKSDQLNFVRVSAADLGAVKKLKSLPESEKIVLLLYSSNKHWMPEMRRFFVEMMHQQVTFPVVMNRAYIGLDDQRFQLFSATDMGGLLLDGMGDGVFIETERCSTPQLTTSTAFGILQATRTRISKTEYISCPSCGRTLFDLQETTAKIRSKTSHLKGLKIGVMGCIVNGPGEMADADYGYVGVGKGKINLYKQKTVIKKSINEDDAVTELINLIKEYGDWVEPTV
ncbi:MAG: (E)-4-hydroxy-3-methylbut-2-enyl-diphosphate synthase [Crocinitomicaceae bacterium]|nr:(E)-4-hydroxy-3-methylbut-2-enyl-diphosphate synthase [Crocinitomicaceae bacterium]